MREPPDKYHTMKCPLKNIIIDTKNTPILFDAMMRTHKLVIQAYQFIRLWILKKYSDKKDIPEITENTIKIAFIILNGNIQDNEKGNKIDNDEFEEKKKAGPKPKGENADLLSEFEKFYKDEYKDLGYTKISALNLSQILCYMATDMMTNIENNIKLNFISYVKRFVNSSFIKEHNEIIEKAEKNTKTKIRKELNKDLFVIKQDLLNNTLLSNQKYHEWINKHKTNIFPKEYKNSYEFDVQNNPQNYIKCMIYMCLELEKNEAKSFQFFPLRTQIYPKYIPIDTKSLIELFVKGNKKEYLDNIEQHKKELWKSLFNLDNPIFKQKDYVFDYRISTDCFSVSIQLLKKCYVEQSQLKKENMKKAKNEIKEKCKDMTQEKKEKYKKQLEKEKKAREEKMKLLIKEKKDKEKENFKKLSKEEQNKIKDKIKEEQKNKRDEFPYLEDLDDNELEELKSSNLVYVDPGKRTLLMMMNNEGKFLNYTNRTHITQTKRLKYQRLLENYKEKQNITEIENKLKDYNSKTCNYNKFKDYIKNKNKINNELMEKYSVDIFRQYKWYGFINKKKAETNLINTIKKTFKNNKKQLPTLIYGDWSIGKQMKNYISTPNVGLKRKLGEYFIIYSIDEFRTSLLNYKTEEVSENIYLPDKKGEMRKIHSILTYQMENKRLGCINRDKNSVKNMCKLTKYYLEHKSRPERYKRGYDLGKNKIKATNPVEVSNSSKLKEKSAIASKSRRK
jgi:hypothetical protein